MMVARRFVMKGYYIPGTREVYEVFYFPWFVLCCVVLCCVVLCCVVLLK